MLSLLISSAAWVSSALLVTNMPEAEADTVAQQVPEDLEGVFSSLDVLILTLLVGGVAIYILYKRKLERENAAKRTYSIQPSMMSMQSETDNSFIKKLTSSNRSLVVFYGSQTGTGEEFAGRLAKEGVRYRMKGMVADPEECDMEELVNMKNIPNSLAVFCLATYGEGDPTDNAMEFVDWLKTMSPDLTGLNYAVFGLGNKTYEHYNEVAIYVDEKLETLGATRVFELGLGDDDANIEEDFITWKDRFWPAVCEHFGIESTGEEVSMRQYRLEEFEDDLPQRIFTGEMARLNSLRFQKGPYDAKNPYISRVLVNRELHKSGGRSCMHIELDIEEPKMRYDAGDHLGVYPVNNEKLVEKLGELCGKNLDVVFSLTNTDDDSSKKHPFPSPCSYRTALTHYLDITSNPRTHILKELIEYCSDPEEKEKLILMSSLSVEGKALYQSWIIDDNRNIVHILEDLPSCKPALDHLCELLPRLQPRYYSISSSPILYPDSVHITAVVVEYETPTGRLNKGVATTWLKHKIPAEGKEHTVPIFIRKSGFRLPSRTQTPVLMIGPGTGLAPFRGFIQERNAARESGKPVGETILYFGCRKKTEDYIYQEELEAYERSGLLKLHLAFSRDQQRKIYVSHLLEQNADEVWSVIKENEQKIGGNLYICGDAKAMAADVRNIIQRIIEEKGNMTAGQAQEYLKSMEAQKRLSADVWS